MTRKTSTAIRGENIAARFLEKTGFTIQTRNYRYGHGEIDIIAADGEYTVFVEVKTRTSSSYGPPEHAVTPAKQKQLVRVARGYMFEKQRFDLPCRFDVVTVDLSRGEPDIGHIRNAFTLMP